MRTMIPIVSIVGALLIIAAGLVIGYGLLPSRTASESNVSQSQTSLIHTSSSSTNYPSRAYLAIVGSAGNGDDAYFAPSSITVAVNATVIWTNQDRGVVHNVVSTSETSFNSGDINPGATWSFTFTNPGTYTYFCSYHPWMTGSVTVASGTTGA